MHQLNSLLLPIRTLHEQIRDAVVAACEQSSLDAMSLIDHDGEGDTIYAVDRISEDLLVDFFSREIAPITPIVLIAEGLAAGKVVLPLGTPESEAVWRIIIDPIDGTRGLMYQKRSAWILTGVAPNLGDATNLQDIELAVQTEIPLVKQHLSDSLWAIKGHGAEAERFNRVNGRRSPLPLQPSRAATIAHGFAMLSRFFPGARDVIAAIDEEIVLKALGPVQPGKAHCFEDQYICTGGQFYELMAGHDRFVGDIRPLMDELLSRKGMALGICCHPYDVCTELIAREMGIIVTDPAGSPLRSGLNVDEDVAWVGYANEAIRQQIAPLLHDSLTGRGMLS